MKVSSKVDVITNSSSECFIIKNEDLDKLNLSSDILRKITRIETIDDILEADYRELYNALKICKPEHYGPSYGNVFQALREFGHTEEEIEAWKKKKIEEAEILNDLAMEDYKKDPRVLRSLGKSYIWNYGDDWDLMRNLEKKLQKKNIKYKVIPW